VQFADNSLNYHEVISGTPA